MPGSRYVSVVFLILASVLVALGANPSPPKWPLQFQATVTIAENPPGFVLSNSSSIPTTYSGSYYYNFSSSPSVAFYLNQRFTSKTIRQVITTRNNYVIDLSNSNCSSNVVSRAYWQILPPNFVTSMNFKFLGWDYFVTTEGEALLETHHWQSQQGSLTIDYWHATSTSTPFRLAWSDTNIVLIQFSSFLSTFDNLPNPAYYFSVPSNCINSASKSHPTHTEAIATNSRAEANANGWPFAWHGSSRYTGNDFGLQDTNTPVIPFTLAGHYYYDWNNQRECNIWSDLVTGQRTKTLIINGTFHLVTLSTGKCQLVPTYPVNGPLKPIWPTGLPYIDDQWLYLEEERSFLKAGHYRFDALNIGVEHAFHYWQSKESGTPRMFQGPVLEVWPYGQSMMMWGEVQLGLNGVDLDYVFDVPNDCSYIPLEGLKETLGEKMHSLVSHLSLIHKMSSKQ